MRSSSSSAHYVPNVGINVDPDIIGRDPFKLLAAVVATPRSTQLPLPQFDTAGQVDFVLLFGVLFLFVVLCATLYILYPRMATYALENGSVQYPSHDTVRSQFQDLPLTRVSDVKNHTHGLLAADRSSASLFAERLARASGMTPFYYQMSAADQRHKLTGSRQWYWAKDTHIMPRPCDPTPGDMFVQIDVDYYVDMNAQLMEYNMPTLLYTLQPECAAKETEEYSYTFQKDNQIVHRVAGGGLYPSKIWNYSTDSVLVTREIFGFRYAAATYHVDRRATMPDHQMVLLTPIRKWSWWAAPFTYLLADQPLTVLKPNDGEFTRLRIHAKTGMIVSTARVGGYACSNLKAAEDDALAALARTSSIALTLPSVSRFTNGDVAAATPAYEYHRLKSYKAPVDIVPVYLGVRTYQYEPKNYLDAAPMLKPFMSPLIHASFSPANVESSEARAVKSRITDVTSEAELSSQNSRFLDEFLIECFPEPHLMTPTEIDTVFERQPRLSQQRLLHEGCISASNGSTQTFLKKESYSKIQDPRIISTICPADKLEYSKYTYSMADWMKHQSWYAFGKTPRSNAERVAAICSSARASVCKTDFSRMDGHISPACREIEVAFMMRAFRKEYHAELMRLHRSQYGLKAFGRLGTRYSVATARLSGSPETSLFNTLINVYVAYVALRKQGMEHREAYDALGIYGGDDGLTADIDPKVYTKAAESVGQILTVEPVLRGEPGVEFLARCFSPDVWYGSEHSCCNIARQLSKFHTTVNMPSDVTPLMKFTEKLRGFAISDANTPIFKQLLQKSIALGLKLEPNYKTKAMANFHADVPVGDHYPNAAGDWMQDLLMKQLPDLTDGGLAAFDAYLSTAHEPEQLLAAPLLVPVAAPKAPAVDVVVDDVTLKAAPAAIDKSAATTTAVASAPATAPSQGPKPAKVRTCHNCGKPGHIAKECAERHKSRRAQLRNGKQEQTAARVIQSTPAARLVGIELNPGPDSSAETCGGRPALSNHTEFDQPILHAFAHPLSRPLFPSCDRNFPRAKRVGHPASSSRIRPPSESVIRSLHVEHHIMSSSALVPILRTVARTAVQSALRPRSRRRGRNRPATTAVVLAPRRRARATQRRRRPRTALAASSRALPGIVVDYINTLNNPFLHGAVRLGWGTMLPTSLYTAYYRGSLTTNSDGSFALAMLPTIAGVVGSVSSIVQNVAGANTATWTSVSNFLNTTAIQNSAADGRVVSGGIRVFPMVPATSSPGALYAMTIPTTSYNSLATTSPSSLSTIPFAKIGYGATGAAALVHPTDPVSFQMQVDIVSSAFVATNQFTVSVPVIAGLGFPASTTVYFEAVLNLETIMNQADSSGAITSMSASDAQESMAWHHASMDAMWAQLRNFIKCATLVNSASTLHAELGERSLPGGQGPSAARNAYFAGGTNNLISRDPFVRPANYSN